MWYFRKIDPFDSLICGKFVTLVGAGGKTSLAECLGREALRRGKRVALTTTTKIWAREPYVTTSQAGWRGSSEPLVHVGRTVEGGKLTGLDTDEVASIGKDFDLVLIEADGSKGKPLKYPAAFEPVIPALSERVLVLAGLDALSGRVAKEVFRWELFSERTQLSGDDEVSSEVFLRLFERDGMMKGVDTGKCVVVLNKYDACTRRSEALAIVRRLCERLGCATPIVLASTRFGFFYGCEQISAPPEAVQGGVPGGLFVRA
jgi:probable selenium-dependent hydroxylase accessory protein YqeC